MRIKINYISILNDPELKNRDGRMKHVEISYMQYFISILYGEIFAPVLFSPTFTLVVSGRI